MSDATKNKIESIKRLIKHTDEMFILLQEMKTSLFIKNASKTLTDVNHIKQMNNVRYDVI